MKSLWLLEALTCSRRVKHSLTHSMGMTMCDLYLLQACRGPSCVTIEGASLVFNECISMCFARIDQSFCLLNNLNVNPISQNQPYRKNAILYLHLAWSTTQNESAAECTCVARTVFQINTTNKQTHKKRCTDMEVFLISDRPFLGPMKYPTSSVRTFRMNHTDLIFLYNIINLGSRGDGNPPTPHPTRYHPQFTACNGPVNAALGYSSGGASPQPVAWIDVVHIWLSGTLLPSSFYVQSSLWSSPWW